MSIPGFDAAQAAYDARMPPEYPPFYCTTGEGSSEDCDHEGDCTEQEDDGYDEPPDFDDYKNGTGRYAEDYWLDD